MFIPVYVFLAIPVVSALADDPQRFLERNAKLQWGIMVCVYGMSHVPALLLLDFPDYEGKGAFLVFFLVFVVQTCMLVQHLLTRRLKRPPSAPTVSHSFNWTAGAGHGWWAAWSAALLSFITPFKPGQALAMAFIACVAGSMGHLVMKALKRDRGITGWGQRGCRSPAPTACWTGSTRCASRRRSSFTRCAGTSVSERFTMKSVCSARLACAAAIST